MCIGYAFDVCLRYISTKHRDPERRWVILAKDQFVLWSPEEAELHQRDREKGQ